MPPTSLRQASESLAGRIEVIEIGSFDLEEVGVEATETLWQRGGFPLSFLARHLAGQSVPGGTGCRAWVPNSRLLLFLISKILQPVPRTSSYRLRMPVSSAMDGNVPLAPVHEPAADSHSRD